MAKQQKKSKGRCTRRVLRIPDREHSEHAVINSLPFRPEDAAVERA
jgi:hypothetical protein